MQSTFTKCPAASVLRAPEGSSLTCRSYFRPCELTWHHCLCSLIWIPMVLLLSMLKTLQSVRYSWLARWSLRLSRLLAHTRPARVDCVRHLSSCTFCAQLAFTACSIYGGCLLDQSFQSLTDHGRLKLATDHAVRLSSQRHAAWA